MHPDRRGKARLDAALRVDPGGQRVQRDALLGGNLSKRAPELFLQRDAGAMAAQGQRMFDRARAHRGPCRGALPPSPHATISPGYLSQDETRRILVGAGLVGSPRLLLAHPVQIDRPVAHFGPIMSSGRTTLSKVSASTKPSAIASSFSVVPFLCAVLATLVALS